MRTDSRGYSKITPDDHLSGDTLALLEWYKEDRAVKQLTNMHWRLYDRGEYRGRIDDAAEGLQKSLLTLTRFNPINGGRITKTGCKELLLRGRFE